MVKSGDRVDEGDCAYLTSGLSNRKQKFNQNSLIATDVRSEYFPNAIYRCGFYKNIDVYCSTQIGKIIDNGM
jgi:hypothetical protein